MNPFRYLKFIAIFAGSVLVASASAHTNLWEQNVVTAGLNPDWGFFAEFQPRWTDHLSQKQQMILRGAVLHRLNDRWRLGLGYGWFKQYPSLLTEDRIFEQVDYRPPSEGAWGASVRGRLEQRFLERTTGITWRVRAKGQLNWMPNDWGLYVWDEVFFHLNDQPGQIASGFEQNRLSVGPRFAAKPLTVELGYLLQTVRSVRGTTQSNPGVTLSLSANFW